jgi:formyl-CoA transferase
VPSPNEPPLPLQGVKVLDLANLYAGPLIAATLADFGAEVVKVEHPRGDDARRWGLTRDEVPLWWKVIARNKRLIALDLNLESDREIVRRLVAWCDIVIEGFRPGRMEEWGLGYDDLARINPRVILLRVSGFGQFGPYFDRPGFGTLAEAFSGFAHITGLPGGAPTLPPFGLADGVAALAGTYAAVIALYWRDTAAGGRGQSIDLSLYEPLFSILGPQLVEYTQCGVVQQRQGNRSSRTSPRNAYVTSDSRWVALSAGTQQIANRIFAAIDRPDLATDEKYASPQARAANADEIDAIVASWMRLHTLDEILQRFEAHSAPIAPVLDIEQIRENPHYQARESFIEVDDQDLGTIWMQNVVPKLSRTPGRIRHAGKLRPDADRSYILHEILEPDSAHDDEDSVNR